MERFTKAERLSNKKDIETLFTNGKSLRSYPFQINWREASDTTIPITVLITVPKRIYKKAVDRNRIKRKIKEAYRKNKVRLNDKLNSRKIHLVIIYTSKTALSYQVIEEKLIGAIDKINL